MKITKKIRKLFSKQMCLGHDRYGQPIYKGDILLTLKHHSLCYGCYSSFETHVVDYHDQPVLIGPNGFRDLQNIPIEERAVLTDASTLILTEEQFRKILKERIKENNGQKTV